MVDGLDGHPGASRSALDRAMDRYADGDDAAFAVVFDELAPRLHRFALRETRSASAAEDVVQQALLQIHAARTRFVRGAAVLPWAYAIAGRLLIDGRRRAWREVPLPERGGGEAPGSAEPASEAGGADEALDVRRRDAELRGDLAALPEKLRRPFELVRLEGLTVAEAAEVLGISRGMVKIRAHRAGLALRAADGRRRRPT